MREPKTKILPAQTEKQAREARLAEALRANLKRRKAPAQPPKPKKD